MEKGIKSPYRNQNKKKNTQSTEHTPVSLSLPSPLPLYNGGYTSTKNK
jgi:hypothetical protein